MEEFEPLAHLYYAFQYLHQIHESPIDLQTGIDNSPQFHLSPLVHSSEVLMEWKAQAKIRCVPLQM